MIIDELINNYIDDNSVSFHDIRVMFENDLLRVLMRRVKNNQSRAAIQWGCTRSTFRTLLKERFGDEYIKG